MHPAGFVAAMEDVLDVYHRPYDEKRTLVCLNEGSKQLVGEVVEPIPAEPGQPERYDYEYTRHGTSILFMVTMPLLGWRAVLAPICRHDCPFCRSAEPPKQLTE